MQSLHMLCHPEMYGLRHGTADFERAAQEFLQEARLLHSLRHDNIVTLRGVTMHPEHGHVQWLVTERASGGSLEAWLSVRGVLALEELLDLLRSVMRALVYLHSRTPSVLHRDVKPANVLVFVTSGGGIVWKLGDVGIAKVLQSTARARTHAGTPMYTAADVLLGPYDGKVDVFSTGIMAAELVVRHMDIGGFDRVDADMYRDTQHRAAMVDDACRRLERVSPVLASVVRGCSTVKAKHRMGSEDARRALDAIVIGGTAGTAAVPRPPSASVQCVDISEALDAMESLHIPLEVSDHVCDAMAIAGAASETGDVTGAQFLRLVVDSGVKTTTAAKLRRRLRIVAPVPPSVVSVCPLTNAGRSVWGINVDSSSACVNVFFVVIRR
jgi:serine/threonine protein kinase